MSILSPDSPRLLSLITASSAIQMRNQSLLEEEAANGSDDIDGDGPPAKRARTGRVNLDDEEAAFASSLTPLHLTLGDMSQYKNIEVESQDSDADGDREEHDADADDADADDADGNGVGFLDNGVCFLVFFS